MKRPNKWRELIRTLYPTLRWVWFNSWREWARIRETSSPHCICPVDYYLAECPDHGDTAAFYAGMPWGEKEKAE